MFTCVDAIATETVTVKTTVTGDDDDVSDSNRLHYKCRIFQLLKKWRNRLENQRMFMSMSRLFHSRNRFLFFSFSTTKPMIKIRTISNWEYQHHWICCWCEKRQCEDENHEQKENHDRSVSKPVSLCPNAIKCERWRLNAKIFVSKTTKKAEQKKRNTKNKNQRELKSR